MSAARDVIVYGGRRLSTVLWASVFVPLTALCVALAFAGIVVGDTDVRFPWLTVPLAALCGLLSYLFVKNLIWPPRLEITGQGLSWANFGTADASYGWEEIDGPHLKNVRLRNDIFFVCFTVKSTGRELELPLNDIGGATFDELAAVISSARKGKMNSPEEQRLQDSAPTAVSR
jgi:hypothetical protein